MKIPNFRQTFRFWNEMSFFWDNELSFVVILPGKLWRNGTCRNNMGKVHFLRNFDEIGSKIQQQQKCCPILYHNNPWTTKRKKTKLLIGHPLISQIWGADIFDADRKLRKYVFPHTNSQDRCSVREVVDIRKYPPAEACKPLLRKSYSILCFRYSKLNIIQKRAVSKQCNSISKTHWSSLGYSL